MFAAWYDQIHLWNRFFYYDEYWEKPILSTHGVVTSLAWKIGGKVNYVLEGNLNYTGAVITWLKDDLQIISSPGETGKLAKEAIQEDSLYLVPAFSGLGAPYWDSEARASVVGMSRTTRKAEFVRAALECIAYQITDVVQAMSEDAGVPVKELRVDGGPTRNDYLMQFQSNIADAGVLVPDSRSFPLSDRPMRQDCSLVSGMKVSSEN